ncbi:AraC family transcriptional regulator [Paenibacillus gorillae]|uniref:AraC family transcriptional regulator n=1 Tax=Paenibacillus gorillae TaxID=1243662 RepID=UPI00138AEF09|nr:AraC family transcriptional regulator [Paenibacillus gorillae]
MTYHLPSNCFMYVVKGKAAVSLGDIRQNVKSLIVLHGVKGSVMQIDRVENTFEYYLIYYGAELPELIRRRLLPVNVRSGAYHHCYSIEPVSSADLLHQVREMHEAWEGQRRDKLQKIRVKSLLYQFVYEVLHQANTKGALIVRNDIVAQAIHYMNAHYAKPITLEQLAESLNCSTRHLTRLFKNSTGSSPIEYIIDIRITKAKELLVSTDATLQEIAESIGQPDSYYFSRMFKKRLGVSPLQYRKEKHRDSKRPYMSSRLARYDIGGPASSIYNSDKDYHYYSGGGEGNSMMYRSNKLAVTMLLCLTLVLSACSATGNSGSGTTAGGNSTPALTQQNGTGQAGTVESSTPQQYAASIETKFGTVEITQQPQRIVALGWGDAETVLSLGYEPVGASDWVAFGGDGIGPWLEGSYKNSPTLIGTLEPDYELIASLKPDLIFDVKSSGDEERYKRLSEIATTVGIPAGADRYKTSSEDQLRIIAKALNKEAEGEALLKQVNDRFAKAVSEHPEFAGKTAVVGSYQSSGFGAYVTGSTRIDFVTRLGFVVKPEIEKMENTNFAIKVADERLELLDADLTVIVPIGVEPNIVREHPLFQKVPSVAEGRALVLDRESSRAFSTGSIKALLWTIDHLVPQFAEMLDGKE